MRHTFVVAAVILSVVGGLFFHRYLISPNAAHAQGACMVPKNYGTFKGYGNLMVFEASDGTLRLVDPNSCKVLFSITRQ
jgi:hypothetical protein